MKNYQEILSHFALKGTVTEVTALGNGLINDTLKVATAETDCPDYVLQRINNSIFTDVDLLQHNIDVTTSHIRAKLMKAGVADIDRYRTNLACFEYEFEQGMKKGLAEGEAKATLKNAKAMKDLSLPIETIARVTGLTIEEIEKL